MGSVGPRPLLLRFGNAILRSSGAVMRSKPGLTGWAQVNGRNALSWNERFALDVWYVDHQSFWLDLKIIALTVWTILQQGGINQSNHTTMEEFRGQRLSDCVVPQELRGVVRCRTLYGMCQLLPRFPHSSSTLRRQLELLLQVG
jgi:hypothetical protein